MVESYNFATDYFSIRAHLASVRRRRLLERRGLRHIVDVGEELIKQ